MRRLLSLFGVLMALSFSLQAQQYPFLKWSTGEGLAQSQVRCIAQDHVGYLWVGTLGGVSRFNGRSFKNFSRRDGLLSNQVNSIAMMGDSLIVFGSIGGVTVYDGSTFRRFLFPEGFTAAQVNHMLPTAAGALLIGTENGLLELTDSLQVRFGPQNDYPIHVKRIVHNDENDLFLVTRGEVLRVRHPGGQPETIIERERIDAVVLDGCPGPNGTWLLATVGKGLLHVDNEHITAYSVENGLVSENITGITADDRNQRFWVRSRDGISTLVLNENGADIRSFETTNGLDVTDVRAIFIDREQNLWLGTYGGGLRKFVGTAVQHFNAQSGLAGDIVMTILPPEFAVRPLQGCPPVILGRGRQDAWYPAAQFTADVDMLASRFVIVEPCETAGGHEWSAEFADNVGRFLLRLTTPGAASA